MVRRTKQDVDTVWRGNMVKASFDQFLAKSVDSSTDLEIKVAVVNTMVLYAPLYHYTTTLRDLRAYIRTNSTGPDRSRLRFSSGEMQEVIRLNDIKGPFTDRGTTHIVVRYPKSFGIAPELVRIARFMRR